MMQTTFDDEETQDVRGEANDVTNAALALPAELWLAILQSSTLQTVVSITATCRHLRDLCTAEPSAWTSLEEAAYIAGVHAVHAQSGLDGKDVSAMRRKLAMLGGSTVCCPPPMAWARLLPVLSRSFILWDLELPRMPQAYWTSIFFTRFPPTIIEHDVGADGTPKDGRKWKEIFLRRVAKLEHRAETTCAQEEHTASIR
ncbi:hypothetical protein P7C70_g6, partial [Phenoliferia sp. Uapishka_3]